MNLDADILADATGSTAGTHIAVGALFLQDGLYGGIAEDDTGRKEAVDD